MSTPIVLSIDVEPDQFFDPSGDWTGFEAAAVLIEDRRPLMAAATGHPVPLVWNLRMDHQIAHEYGDPAWVFHRYGSELRSLEDAGDVIGLHIHPYRLRDGAWVSDYEDLAWVMEAIGAAVDTFSSTTGRRPTTVSLGFNWTSSATIAQLTSMGVRYVMDIEQGTRPEPFYDGIGTFLGRRPSFEAVPAHPYRPDPDDFAAESTEGSLWVIPLSSVGGDDDRRKLDIPRRPEELAELIGSNPSYLSAAIRTSSFLQPDGIIDSLEALVRHGARFVTPEELVGYMGLATV